MSIIALRAILAALPLILLTVYHMRGWLRRGPRALLAFQAVLWGGMAAIQVIGHQPWYAFPDGITAAVFGHAAWEVWRRGRKPRSERATGRIVNLGHRLAVVTGGKP